MLFAETMIESTLEIPRPLRVAVIGTGFAERVHIPAFIAHPVTEVVAICSRRESKARAAANKHQIRGVYTDYRTMLETEKPDMVSIVTPPNLHLEMALASFEAGAHVLCEKPLAMNVDEARQMLEAAEKHQKVHIVNHEFRYFAARFYQKVLVEEGYIGQPLLVEGIFQRSFRANPDAAWTWWSDAQAGGGALGALGSHMIDTFQWLLDEPLRHVMGALQIAYPTRLDETGERRSVTADDSATLAMESVSGVPIMLQVSGAALGNSKRVAIHGTQGVLIVENDARLIGRQSVTAPLEEITIPDRYTLPVMPPGTDELVAPFIRLVDLMTDKIFGYTISQNNLQPANFADGLSIQRVLDAAQRSHMEGTRQTI